jgi:hypothetical protein
MTRLGVGVVVGATAALATTGTLLAFAWRSRAAGPAEVEPIADLTAAVAVAQPSPPPAVAALTPSDGAPAEVPGASLVERLLIGPDEALEGELLAMGDAAVAAVRRRLASGEVSVEGRERLIGLVRRVPGKAAEDLLIAEALGGPQRSTRTMALDALAERKTDRAFETLATVARSDPELPARPLIAQPLAPDDLTTELPDEESFTPRMQAMAALAGTNDPRSVPVLAEMARSGPDEALRMEAARHLGNLRDDPRAAEALRAAALRDPSAYVRLSALHSLNGSSDPSLPGVLATIVAQDRHAGVRLLAQRVMDGLHR